VGASRSSAEQDPADVRPLADGDAPSHTSIRRAEVAAPGEAGPDGNPESSYELLDAKALGDVIASCRRAGPTASVRAVDDVVYVAHFLGAAAEHDEIVVALEPDGVPDGPCAVRFEVHDVLFILRGQIQRRDQRWVIARPFRLYTVDRRAAARTPVPDGRAELVWSSLDPDDSRPARSSVRDLSPTGVGVVADDESDQLPDKMFPAELRVGTTVIPCLAHARRRAAGTGQTSGVRIYAGDLSRGLIETYLSERMPQLTPRSSVDCDAMHKLMVESGYLSLRDSDLDFRAWKDFAPSDLVSCDRVYRAADGTPVGHISATRIYSRTWLLHQLSCLRGHPESNECRKLLYLFVAAVPTIYDGYESSIVAYFDQNLRWHKLFFKRFTEWANDAAVATIVGFDRFERDDSPDGVVQPEGCEVREALEPELLAACTLARAHLPEITAEAFDLNPTSIRRIPTKREQRGRHVLVLRQKGTLAGIALCETGDPNTSLFNLVNLAQIYLRTGRSAPSTDAQIALVSAVRSFYAARGVRRPLIVAPPGTLNGEAEAGTRLAETMGCIVVNGRGLRLWENFCRFYFGFLWDRQGQHK
jgi:hypothetical protein